MQRVPYVAALAAAVASIATSASASRVISSVEYSNSDHVDYFDSKDQYDPSAKLQTQLIVQTHAAGDPGYTVSQSVGASTAWYGLQQVEVHQMGQDGLFGANSAWENIRASAYVEDTLHLNFAGLPAGTTGWAHFALSVDGSDNVLVAGEPAYAASATATTSVQVTLSGSGVNMRYGYFAPLSLVADTDGFQQFRADGAYDANGSLQFTTLTRPSMFGLYMIDVPFIAGGSITIATNVSCISQIQQFAGAGSVFSDCDMAHTVRWGGLIDAVDSDGAPVDLTVTSESGLDYRLAVSEPGGVPEPATWAFLIAGFGGLGARVRRYRRSKVAPRGLLARAI